MEFFNSLGISSEKNYYLRYLILKLFKQKFTVFIISICAILILFKQINNPISCNIPDDLKGNESVINRLCYSEMDNIVENENLTVNDNQRMKRLLGYHASTHLILWNQAFLLYIAGYIWSTFIDYSSVEIETILEEVNYLKPNKEEYDENQLKNAISTFGSFLNSRNPHPFWKRYGSKYALVLFSFSKISFTIISFVQLYYFNDFIADHSSNLFGVEFLSRMWHGESLSEWSIFPRDAICNLSTSRRNESDKKYSVHCHLIVNQLNDKIFIFLWFWWFLASIMNLIDLISWMKTFLILNKQDTYTYVRNRVNVDFTKPKNEILLRQFIKTYLPEDLVIMFRVWSLHEYLDAIVSKILPKFFNLFVAKQN